MFKKLKIALLLAVLATPFQSFATEMTPEDKEMLMKACEMKDDKVMGEMKAKYPDMDMTTACAK